MKYIKTFSKVFSNFLSLAITIIVVLWLNKDDNQLKISLYNLGYAIYGESSQFIQNIYNQFRFCDSNETNLDIIRTQKYLEQQNAALANELQLLKSKMNFIQNQEYKYVSAMVTQITYPKDEAYLVISAGAKDGINIGNLVINEDGIIGRIASVSNKFAVISLLGNENVKIASVIQPINQDCIVNKKLQNKDILLEISYITDNEKLQGNEKVITSGKDGVSPYGIEIGVVRVINGKPYVEIKHHPKNATVVSVITHD